LGEKSNGVILLRDLKEKRDFLIMIVSISILSCISVFVMVEFWWLTLNTIGMLLIAISVISFIPGVLKVDSFKKANILLVFIGVMCAITAIFVIVPSRV
jgi:phage-related holin